MIARTLIAAAVVFGGMLMTVPEADAGGYRRARFSRSVSRNPGYFKFQASEFGKQRVRYNLPQLNQQERRRVYRQQAWYEHAFNGFTPFDFR